MSVNIDYCRSSVGHLAIGILNGCETAAVLYGIRSGDRRSWAGRSRRHLPNPNTGDTIIGSACRPSHPGAISPSVASVRLSGVTGQRGGFTRPPAAKSILFGPTNRSAGDLRKPPSRSERNPVRTASRHGSRSDPGHRYSLIPAVPARPTSESESGEAWVRRLIRVVGRLPWLGVRQPSTKPDNHDGARRAPE